MNMTPPPGNDTRLAILVQLEQRLRACADIDSLRFLLVNDTYALTPYRQAVLWQRHPGQAGRLTALSGLALPDRNAPLNVWLAGLLDQHNSQPTEAGPLLPELNDTMWQEHLPAHAWWHPLPLGKQHTEQAGLLLLRDTPWQAADTALLTVLADAAGHAWASLHPVTTSPAKWLTPPWRRTGWSYKHTLLAILAAATVLLFPVRQSVLAPAEIVARQPVAIRAPLPGVVDHIDVQPNQHVKAGQLLAGLDARELEGRLEAARQALAVADAELRQGQQQALFDERSKAGLALLQGKRDQAATDADYLASALERTQLRAPRAGTVIFDDAADWIGKPVATGERILQLANPQAVELEIQLPINDAIALPKQADVQLFLNSAPASPVDASVQRMAYRATPTADGTLAYKVRATLATGETAPRIGLKGTAKLYGSRTPLLAYVLRRPLATLRVWLGV